MMAITTSSSIRVKALRLGRVIFNFVFIFLSPQLQKTPAY